MHRHRPFLFGLAALALSGALLHPSASAALAAPVPRFNTRAQFGGSIPPRGWRNPWRHRSKPPTTVAHERRKALKRRRVLRERARR